MLDYQRFVQSVEVLTDHEAIELRQKYIYRFVNRMTDYYRTHIGLDLDTEKHHTYTYTGYLWDTLNNPTPISVQTLQRWISEREGHLYVLWDLHSPERVPRNDYFKFAAYDVLLVQPGHLLEGMQYLPEDIYVFQASLEESVIRTHEHWEDGRRHCLRAT